MSAFSIGLLIEVIVAGLLVATIAYCFLLDRRLRALRDGESDLKQIVVSLDRATSRAQSAITDLRVHADGMTRDLERDLKKARALADELALMVEAGDSIADRLGTFAGAGGPSKTRKDTSADAAGIFQDDPQDDPLAETGLAAALRQVR
ncbi:DUF6468 domain-containing protein [Pyruvatibacter sp.]|uniref:DUF6468 domain-containing protein n=1 Tax=Pyruvatibacter sp. TaxID=1981328 RepID=UPI0032EC0784